MNKDDKLILAIKRELLFQKGHFIGFKQASQEFENIILENFEFKRRGDVEHDSSYKQPIGYAIIINPKTKKIYIYQRASDPSNYHESRLYEKWSMGIGGHIDKTEENSKNPIYDSLLRELSEEVNLNGKILDVKVLGYINDEVLDIDKHHIGVLYIIETDSEKAEPKFEETEEGLRKESTNSLMLTVEEIEDLAKDKDLENWSRIALKAIKGMI